MKKAKCFWEFLVRMVLILALVTTAVIAPACADVTPASLDCLTSLTVIGGDGDNPTKTNSLFNQVVDDQRLADMCVFNFVSSVSGDYSNSTAISRAQEAEQYTKQGYGRVCVAGYSHGGQSVYFMDMTGVNEIFLVEATTQIKSVCSEPDTVGYTWADWVICAASFGINVHVYATDDTYGVSIASRNTINNIDTYAKNSDYRASNGATVQKIDSTHYSVTFEGRTGIIECVFIGGSHGQACVNAAPYIFATLAM